jgi:hypothetical protein
VSFDSYESWSHLTPKGWITGTPIPDDRAETWKLKSDQQSPYSKQYDRWSRVWASEAISRTLRDHLRSKYGLPGGETGYIGGTKTIVTHGDPL